jgi:trigger factor
LKIETETREDHQVKLITEVEADQFERSKHQAARKIAQKTKIPGFRPGKAPYAIIERTVGAESIQEEAIELLVDEIYPEIIKEAGIEPGGPGNLDEVISMDPPKFSFIVPLAPKVELGDYTQMRREYALPEVTDKEVDEFIERLRASYGTAEPVERAAQEGDLVFMNLGGKLTQPEEGKDPEVVNERPFQVTVKPVEEDPEKEWPYPGFSMQMLGASAGETKTLTYTFTDETPYEYLRGQEIEFTAKIESVKLLKLPDMNDEFAQTVGEFSNLDALRAQVRSGLESNKNEEYDQAYFNQLIDQIHEGASIKYPPQLLNEEMDSVLHSIEGDLAQQKMDLDTYLKIRQIEREKFLETEVKPAAKRRLERSLLLDQVSRAEKIELANDDLQASFQETLSELQNSGDFDQMRKKVGNERFANAIAMEAASRLMNRKVLERLKAIATGEAEKTAEAAVSPTEAAETPSDAEVTAEEPPAKTE